VEPHLGNVLFARELLAAAVEGGSITSRTASGR
jgi:hypothetical protein